MIANAVLSISGAAAGYPADAVCVSLLTPQSGGPAQRDRPQHRDGHRCVPDQAVSQGDISAIDGKPKRPPTCGKTDHNAGGAEAMEDC